MDIDKNTPLLEEDKDEPTDEGNTVYMIFLLWGIGVLLPWNACLSCFDFFANETKGQPLDPSFVYPFAVNGLAVAAQMTMLLYGHKLSYRFKVQTGMYINAGVMVILPFVAHYITDPTIAFWVCFVILFLFGGNNGMVQQNVFGAAGFMPAKYNAAIMFGNGLSGIACNTLKVLFMLILPGADNLYTIALFYFITCAVFMFYCAHLFDTLEQNKYYSYQVKQSENQDEEVLTFAKFWIQFKSNLGLAWSVLVPLLFVFMATFVVFPGTFANQHFGFMKSLKSEEFSWFFITVILIFNVFDTTGRKIAGLVDMKASLVIFGSYFRIIFIIMAVYVTEEDQYKIPVIETSPFRIANLVLFSISNGFFATQCCMKAPGYVPKEQQAQVGLLNGLFIMTGILLGSIFAVPIGSILFNHWAK